MTVFSGVGTRVWIAGILSAGLAFAQASAFDVVSVRPARTDAGGRSFTQRPGGGLSASNVTVRMVVAFAYQVMPEEIVGGPAWAASDGFDIEAKAGEANVSADRADSPAQAAVIDETGLQGTYSFQLRMHSIRLRQMAAQATARSMRGGMATAIRGTIGKAL